jgi:hypothetical protein
VSYATLDEFFHWAKIAAPTPEQLVQGQRSLDAATQEIDSYLGRVVMPVTLTAEEEALLVIVNLDRAFEHWRNTPFGALNTGPDLPPVLTARDSWYRHARKLASLKTSWGVG